MNVLSVLTIVDVTKCVTIPEVHINAAVQLTVDQDYGTMM